MARAIIAAALVWVLALAGCRDAPKSALRQPAAGADSAARPASAESVGNAASARSVAASTVKSAPAGAPVGTYVVEIAAADESKQRFSMDLRADSTCVFITESVGRGRHVESGIWNRDGARLSVVIGPPRNPAKQTSFAFTISGDSLVSAKWDTTRFGEAGLGALVRR